MKNIFFLLLLITSVSFAQQDGYWDKERATSKEVTVSAGDRLLIKTEDFPKGTTEVVYRITLLDNNQQMANSLVSVLKAIPDPSGISQGSAGAVFLLSKVAGDDKCKYAIFSSNTLANDYIENGTTKNACLYQNNPVNKDAKRLSMEKSTCLKVDTDAMWFGFESKNWIMDQRIVLEVVPWVDNKLSKGWTTEKRQFIIDQVKTSDLAKKMIHADDFSICILEKFQEKYSFQEFDRLLAAEKSKAYRDFGNACLTQKPANQTLLNTIRTDAEQHFKNKRYNEAIDLLQTTIIDNENAKTLDYNALGKYYIYSKQYGKAIKYLKIGAQRDETELLIQLNIAHAYLLNGDFGKAKELHKKHRTQNVTASQSWSSKTKSDFEDFKKLGIQNEDFNAILKLLD
jgi:hypothetical protein